MPRLIHLPRLNSELQWQRERFDQASNALFDSDARTPPELALGLSDIGNEDPLVADTPEVVAHRDGTAGVPFEHRTELLPHAQRVRGTPADVVDLSLDSVDAIHGGFVDIQQVVDEQQVAHLLAVAKNGDGAANGRRDGKEGQPALVFHAELARPVDGRLAEDDGGQVVDAGVVAHILVARALAATVGRMEV